MDRKVCYHDGWSGDHVDCERVGYIKRVGKSVLCKDDKSQGRWGVFIPIDIIPALLECGRYVKKDEIDHCKYEEVWVLSSS